MNNESPKIYIKVYAQNKSDIHDLTKIQTKIKDVKLLHLPAKKNLLTLRRNYHGEGYACYDKYVNHVYRASLILTPSLIGQVLKYLKNKAIFLDIRYN